MPNEKQKIAKATKCAENIGFHSICPKCKAPGFLHPPSEIPVNGYPIPWEILESGTYRWDAAIPKLERVPEPVSVSLSKAYHSAKLIGLVENHDGTWASLKQIAQEVLDRVGVKYVD